MNHLSASILCGATFLMAFLIFINPFNVNKKSNYWFALFFICFFLIVTSNIIVYTTFIKDDNLFIELLNLSDFIIAPVYYISVCYYMEPVKKWKARDFLHFIFAFLILILILLSHFTDEKVKEGEVDPVLVANVSTIFKSIFSLQVIIYCILAVRKIARHQKNIQLYNSDLEKIDLKWLKQLSAGVLVIALFWIADILFSLTETDTGIDAIGNVVYLLGILYIAFYWIKQKEVFPYNLVEKKEIETIVREETIPEENRKKLLEDEKLEMLKIELLELIQSRKPYLDGDLSLVKLAEQMNISAHILSYVINKGFSTNFYQFINSYRIELAKKLITDSKLNHYSLLGLGFEVGFNSKTAFNTAFKKLTGQTPSEFKKQNAGKTGTDL